MNTETYLEAEDHQNDQNTSSKTSALVDRWCKADETDDHKNNEDGSQSSEVDRSSTKACHDPPGNEASNESQAVLTNGKMERVVLAKSNSLHELCSSKVSMIATSASCAETYPKPMKGTPQRA